MNPDSAVGSANEDRGGSRPQRRQWTSASEENRDQRCDKLSSEPLGQVVPSTKNDFETSRFYAFTPGSRLGRPSS
jgi:hypothetical protein